MNPRFLILITIFIAGLILYLGGKKFIANYPVDQNPTQPSKLSNLDSESLFTKINAIILSDSAKNQNRKVFSENPFRPVHPPKPAGSFTPKPKADPPQRKFVLRGTVGTEVATISDHSGHKKIVKIGDPIDSAEVISIAPNKVVLKDRAGTFELIQEK